MGQVTGLKGHEWEVIVLHHRFNETEGYYYWEAHNQDPNKMMKLTNRFQFKNEKNAKGNFREFAKTEGITKYKFIE